MVTHDLCDMNRGPPGLPGEFAACVHQILSKEVLKDHSTIITDTGSILPLRVTDSLNTCWIRDRNRSRMGVGPGAGKGIVLEL